MLPWLVLGVYWPMLFIGTHIPRLPELKIYGRDVTLHFSAYLLLTGLFWLARYGRKRPDFRERKLYITLLMIGVYAAVDEITQQLVPHRSGDPWDWVSDLSGALTALVLLMVLRRSWSWLIVYWLGLLVVTHWPVGNSVFLELPGYWQQYQVAMAMVGYVVLTLLWWLTLGGKGYFVFSGKMVGWTIVVLGSYAVMDEVLNVWMGRGFDGRDWGGAMLGIGLGVVCSAALARHHGVTYGEEGPVAGGSAWAGDDPVAGEEAGRDER